MGPSCTLRRRLCRGWRHTGKGAHKNDVRAHGRGRVLESRRENPVVTRLSRDVEVHQRVTRRRSRGDEGEGYHPVTANTNNLFSGGAVSLL